MPEYIERQELIDNLNRFAPGEYSRAVDLVIQKQRAAEVAPVVHCRDCLYSFAVTNQDGLRLLMCTEIGRRGIDPDGFCNYGKRRSV